MTLSMPLNSHTSIWTEVAKSAAKVVSSVCQFLTMLFCVLRACDVITWPWYFCFLLAMIQCGITAALCIVLMVLLAAIGRESD